MGFYGELWPGDGSGFGTGGWGAGIGPEGFGVGSVGPGLGSVGGAGIGLEGLGSVSAAPAVWSVDRAIRNEPMATTPVGKIAMTTKTTKAKKILSMNITASRRSGYSGL